MSRKFVTFFVDKRPQPRRNPPKKTTLVWVGLGSNQGFRRRNIDRAIQILSRAPGVCVAHVSSLYETEPVGGPPQRAHLNGVVSAQTSLSLPSFGRLLKKIEKKVGRKKGLRWGPRVLDLDVLLFGNKTVRSGQFIVPHPRYHLRRFVLVPLCEMIPDDRHPVLKKTHRQLLRGLTITGQRVTMAARWKNRRFYPFKRRKNSISR